LKNESRKRLLALIGTRCLGAHAHAADSRPTTATPSVIVNTSAEPVAMGKFQPTWKSLEQYQPAAFAYAGERSGGVFAADIHMHKQPRPFCLFTSVHFGSAREGLPSRASPVNRALPFGSYFRIW